MRWVLASLLLVAVGCSTGPEAPPVAGATVVCAEHFCVGHPDGWTAEVGPDYLSFTHAVAPERARASVGTVNLEGVVTASGGTWPATLESAVRAFWSLLEDEGLASFERLERRGEGRIWAEGSYENGRMWTLFVPQDSRHAVGMEVRGPNVSWEPHAEAFFDQLVVTP